MDVYLANDPILESNDPLMKNLNNCVGDQFQLGQLKTCIVPGCVQIYRPCFHTAQAVLEVSVSTKMSSHATYCILGYRCNEVVNVDELKSERGTYIASATLGPIISETTLLQLGLDEMK